MIAGVRSKVLPLFLIWLALHAALLGLFLALKFVGAKAMVMLLLMAGIVWFFVRPKPRRLMPPHLNMV